MVSIVIPGGHNVASNLIAFLPYPIPVILGESCKNGDLLKEKQRIPFTDLRTPGKVLPAEGDQSAGHHSGEANPCFHQQSLARWLPVALPG